MNMVRYNYPHSLAEMMRRSFHDSHLNDRLDAGHCGHMAQANIIEDEQGYRIEMPVPGKTRDDFEVSLEKNLLSIRSKDEEKEDDNKYLRREFRGTQVDRSFRITDRIDADQITASCANGILSISLPLRKEELKMKMRREIEIA